MESNKITDRIYGDLLTNLYVIPIFIAFFTSIQKDSFVSFSRMRLLVFGSWFLFSLFYFYSVIGRDIFVEGIQTEKYNFDPFRFFFIKKRLIFLKIILPALETLMGLLILWQLFGRIIIEKTIMPSKDLSYWHAIGFFALLAFFKKIFSRINLVMFRNNKNGDFFQDHSRRSRYDPENEAFVNKILGNYLPDSLAIFLMCFLGTGTLLLLNDFTITLLNFVLSAFLLMLVFNIYYIKKKTGRFKILYSLVGALPFGFIFPASLPQKNPPPAKIEEE